MQTFKEPWYTILVTECLHLHWNLNNRLKDHEHKFSDRFMTLNFAIAQYNTFKFYKLIPGYVVYIVIIITINIFIIWILFDPWIFEKGAWCICKKYRPRSACADCACWSGPKHFALGQISTCPETILAPDPAWLSETIDFMEYRYMWWFARYFFLLCNLFIVATDCPSARHPEKTVSCYGG